MAYKILSLDGGGSWALIQARVLKDIYGDINGHELLRQFDMVISNSGGSLVLAALCNNMKLSDIIYVFLTEEKRKRIFSHLNVVEELQNVFAVAEKLIHIGPKYSTERKLTGLTSVLKEQEVSVSTQPKGKNIVDMYLDELPALIGKESLQLVIAGFDYFKKRANFFRSNTKSAANQFSNGAFFRITLGHAVHASSNAPVNYFNHPATIKVSNINGKDDRTTWYWDGAVGGFNNPVLAGLIEAVTNSCAKMEDYRVLSIGTGTGDRANITDYADSTDAHLKNIYEANKDNPLVIAGHAFNFLHDVKEISSSILMDPPDSATFIAYSMMHPDLKNGGNIVRINPCIEPVFGEDLKYRYPECYKSIPGDFDALLDLDMDAVEDNEVALISGLCDRFIVDGRSCVPNQIIRGKRDSTYIGDLDYSHAKKHWLNIIGGLPGDPVGL